MQLGNFLRMEREKIVMIVAANIKSAMKRRNIDAAKLARAAGVNATGIYDILSGKSRSPRLDTIGKIAKALGVTVSSLCEDRSEDDIKEQIYSVFLDLDDADRERLLLTARSWASVRAS